jgi:cysteine desulfuration protein SufE
LKSIQQIQKEIIAEFKQLDNPIKKYQHLIKLGRDFSQLPLAERTNDRQIPGCQSKVWIKLVKKNDRACLKAASDALITRGLLALILRVFEEQSCSEIVEADLFFLKDSQLVTNLSPSRANSLGTMLKHIQKLCQQ